MLLALVEEDLVEDQEQIELLAMVQVPNFIPRHIVLTLLHSLFAVLEVVVVPLEILVIVRNNVEDLV